MANSPLTTGRLMKTLDCIYIRFADEVQGRNAAKFSARYNLATTGMESGVQTVNFH